FTQLYQKVRLTSTLATEGIDDLKAGVEFPDCSTKRIRKIGGNEIVLGAVELLSRSIDEAYFVALVPDSDTDAKSFFNSKLGQPFIPPLDHWDITKFGYLTWSKVRKFCELNGLENSLRVLRYNQIG
ncbi:MAG: hypothetical protein Q7R39_15640, partial [Dehalococcoidia bacterium]|nr:hypothetical protein [Dehalococcoidia bacterium]